jgi:hypothetical protein
MARTTASLNWGPTRWRFFRNIFIGGMLGAVVLAGLSVPLLKFLYVAGTTKHIFQPMFIGPANLAATAIGTVWELPGIPFWWAHASLPNTEYPTDPANIYWVALVGVALIGGSFLRVSGRNFRTMRNADQQAHEENLKQARLGYPKAVPPQHTNIMHVTARDINAPVVGAGSRANIRINYTYNDLAKIRTLVNDMHTHRQELDLTPQQSVQLNALLRAVREELRSQTPNRTRLHESLLSLRHIVEACTAHMLVGHWGEIVHALRQLTG